MSELTTDQPQQLIDDIEPELKQEAVHEPSAPTLITEQEVLFSTAAAVPAQPTRWWAKATGVVATATRAIFMSSPADSQPKRRHYPPRQSYLEYSRMEREMHRL